MEFLGNTQDGLEMVRKLASLGGEIKVTKVIKTTWNCYEGQNYSVHIKALAPAGKVWTSNKRESLLFEFDTNSTWVEPDEELDTYDEDEKELIEDMVYNACL